MHETKLQLEDVYDCLDHIFPQFNFLIMFDQSSDHMKMRLDVPNIGNMNASYEGAATHMHKSIITKVGRYKGTLSVGETQYTRFNLNNSGPFWIDLLDKLKPKYDQNDGTIVKKEKTKAQLLVDLRKTGFDKSSKRAL